MKLTNNQREKIENGFKQILTGLELNIKNEHFKNTPKRALNSILKLYSGIEDKTKIIDELNVTFPSSYKEIVILKKLKGNSLCPHHLLPIQYLADFAYIPNKKLVGASKPYTVFKILAAQPVTQEDLTEEYIEEFWKRVQPMGCIIKIIGRFFCFENDNIESSTSKVITFSSRGLFNKFSYKKQFLDLIE